MTDVVSARPRSTSRSESTKMKLVGIAERLFAERGIDAVSLNEVGRVADQKHSNICQYYFGDKSGLIQAIFDKHLPMIVAKRQIMFDYLEGRGQVTIEGAVSAFVRPVVAKLIDPDGGVAFVRFAAQMVVPSALLGTGAAPFQVRLLGAERLNSVLRRALGQAGIEESTLARRLLMAAVMLFQGLSAYVCVRATSADTEPYSEQELRRITTEIEAMMIGALTARPESASSFAMESERENHASI